MNACRAEHINYIVALKTQESFVEYIFYSVLLSIVSCKQIFNELITLVFYLRLDYQRMLLSYLLQIYVKLFTIYFIVNNIYLNK